MAAELTKASPRMGRSDSAAGAANQTGLSGQIMALTEAAKRERRPLSTRWMTDELIAYTQRVWSAYLGHPVTEAEAVEMLTNVRNVALALAAAEDGEPRP